MRSEKGRLLRSWQPERCFFATPASFFEIYQMWDYKKKIQFIHTRDYDGFLMDEYRNDVGEEYILFIDEGLGQHPEEAEIGVSYTKKEIEIYHANLRRLFDSLEKHYDQKVIIAEHPKANYRGGEFGEREIIQFQTYELIKRASLVVTSYSTVIGLTALFDKKVLFITDTCAKKIFEGHMLWNAYFGSSEYDIESGENPWEYVWHDSRKYRQYIQDFICYGDESRTYAQVILDELERM